MRKTRDEGRWTGMNGYVEHFDNSDLAIYDMDRYGVDMAVLLPSMLGCSNEGQLAIMDKYPGRFAACCSDCSTIVKYYENPTLDYKFQESLDEVDAALKTGRFSGIGEFAPGLNATRPGVNLVKDKKPSIEERMEQWQGLGALGTKYDVPIHYHDFNGQFSYPDGVVYDYNGCIERILRESPKVKIIASHGGKDPYPARCPSEEAKSLRDQWKDFYTMAAANDRLYLECGGWTAVNFEIAFDCGVKACNIMWGHDYGNVPQYLIREGHHKLMHQNEQCPWSVDERMWKERSIDSLFGGKYKELTPVPTYQSDFYGWSMRVVDRVGDWLTQDEINLMMGGTAARLFKLKVPMSRMFPEARPDIFGENWKENWYPFIPDEQVRHPDPFRLPIDC